MTLIFSATLLVPTLGFIGSNFSSGTTSWHIGALRALTLIKLLNMVRLFP